MNCSQLLALQLSNQLLCRPICGNATCTGYTGATGGGGGGGGGTGDTGATGATGFTGFTGATGYTGSAGTTGYTGADGTATNTGATGYTGSEGITGYTGYTGSEGITGYTGYTGSEGTTGYTGAAGSGSSKMFTIYLDYSSGTALSRIYLPPGFSTSPSISAGGVFTSDQGTDLVFFGTTNIAIANTVYAFPIGLTATGYSTSAYWTATAGSSLGGSKITWQNTSDFNLAIKNATPNNINGNNTATRPGTGVLSGWLATITIYYL